MKALLVLIVVIVVVGVYSEVQFPYTLQTDGYNITWSKAHPRMSIYANLPNMTGPQLLVDVDIANFMSEIQGPSDIYDYTNADEFAEKIRTKAVVIQNVSLEIPFTVTEINEKNTKGLMFTATLSNGAFLLVNTTINPESAFNLPIPRSPNDQLCERDNRYETNCSCEPNHVVDINSFKYGLTLTNWEFSPLRENMTFSILHQNTIFSGPFNLPYYLTLEDQSELLQFDVCDVAVSPLNLSDGNVIIRFSSFSNFFKDGVPTQISSNIGIPSLLGNGLSQFPFIFLYPAFNDSLVYDPDFAVLIGNGGGKVGSSSDGVIVGPAASSNPSTTTGTQTTTNNSGNSNKTMTIIVATVVPVVGILVIVAIVIGAIAGIIIAKKRQTIFAAAVSSSAV